MAGLHVAIRVDAGGQIGVGHAMRCATLGAALVAAGHRVTVVSASLPDWIAERYRSAGAVLERAPTKPVDVWVVDGYELGDEFTELAASGVAVVAIDDNHELPVAAARLVVNQNLHASADLYSDVGLDVRLLLGPSYAMIRRDVTSIDRSQRLGDGRTVLVSFGGTDPAGLTLPVVTALVGVADVDVAVVVALGADHPDRPHVEDLAERHADRIRFDAGDLIDGLRSADVAAIGGGSTLWEVASLGIPAVAAVVADNQAAGTAAAQAAGFVAGVDVRDGDRSAAQVAEAVLALLDDPERRAAMARAGRTLFDGRGAERVVEAIESLV
jgi:spore coat polysaccharide biosynthesis predicted glycosyltransferase SpsG